jgi:hypothetical protein
MEIGHLSFGVSDPLEQRLRRATLATRQKTPLSKINSQPAQSCADELQWDDYSRVLLPTEDRMSALCQ